jgi:hypothetical protein
MAGEFITKVLIWMTLIAYTVVVILRLIGNRKNDSIARIVWTLGCLSLIAHVACAYNYYHSWSYDSSLKETARQTAEVYGINWGGGLFINFFVIFIWIADAIWWWTGLEKYRKRSKAITLTLHSFLFFIFFNATVVFVKGPLRWIGLCTAIVVLYLAIRSATKSKMAVRRIGAR